MPALIIFSGLPGVGKSTLAHALAERLHVALLAIDAMLGIIPCSPAESAASYWAMLYRVLFSFADTQLSLGLSVVLDSVFHNYERQAARELAARHSANFRAVYVYCSDEAVWRERVERRLETTQPEDRVAHWKDTQESQKWFKAWEEGEALFVDAVEDVETNLLKVMKHVKGCV
jgi:predicted kinase